MAIRDGFLTLGICSTPADPARNKTRIYDNPQVVLNVGTAVVTILTDSAVDTILPFDDAQRALVQSSGKIDVFPRESENSFVFMVSPLE